MRTPRNIAVLHPGAMGASLGGALVRAGHRVSWLAEGRSAATADRADRAGLVAASSWAELLAGNEIFLSICPPSAALNQSRRFAAAAHALDGEAPPAGNRLYVDANAVSPRSAGHIAAVVRDAGATFVDGDVIGPPVGQGRTCVYLSGEAAGSVAELFSPDDPQTVVLGDDPTAASALKMLYAGWTKGTSALLLELWAAAVEAGVHDALAAEWEASQPQLAEQLRRAVGGAVPKAWRFAGEMDEIAQTLADLGFPDGFHRAAAELYRRLAEFKDQPQPALSAVLAAARRKPANPSDGR